MNALVSKCFDADGLLRTEPFDAEKVLAPVDANAYAVEVVGDGMLLLFRAPAHPLLWRSAAFLKRSNYQTL